MTNLFDELLEIISGIVLMHINTYDSIETSLLRSKTKDAELYSYTITFNMDRKKIKRNDEPDKNWSKYSFNQIVEIDKNLKGWIVRVNEHNSLTINNEEVAIIRGVDVKTDIYPKYCKSKLIMCYDINVTITFETSL
jgi:hypothetical protein